MVRLRPDYQIGIEEWEVWWVGAARLGLRVLVVVSCFENARASRVVVHRRTVLDYLVVLFQILHYIDQNYREVCGCRAPQEEVVEEVVEVGWVEHFGTRTNYP